MNGTAKADPGAKLVVITGLSGSGKSTVAKCFEDLGYYCVENLPLPLLSRFLDDPAAFVEGQHRIAVVADVRAPGFAAEAPRLLAGVDRGRVAATLVFLDSSDEALVRRRRADAAFEQEVLEQIGRGPDALVLEDELGAIRAPVLLLWCRDDKVIDVSAAETFRRGLAQSTTVILSGCGHMPLMAQPRQVAEAVTGFLAAP